MINQNKIDAYIKCISVKHNFSYENFLCPPVKHCIIEGCTASSQTELTKNNKSTQVVICSSDGLETGSSFQYRCRTCSTVYGYDMYGKNGHKNFYDQQQSMIKATQIMYIKRSVLDFWRQLSLHSQVSFESLAICYNSSFKHKCVMVENIFNMYQDEEDDDEEDVENAGYFLKSQLNRKQVSSGFWAYLVEEESREMKTKPDFIGTKARSYQMFMENVEDLRKSKLYNHDCSDHCGPRACPKSTSMDGIWKIR